jgi:hypothetical protein
MQIEPFTISVPESAIVDLRDRLAQTRWPNHLEGVGWDQGTDRDYLESIVNYWRSTFNWRAQETMLNKLPQFVATIKDQRIHFVYS